MPKDLLDVLLLVLASFRLTHILVFDAIARPLRRAVGGEEEEGRRPFFAQLITCFWCCGVWIAAGCVFLLATYPRPMRWILVVFAVAGGQSLLEGLLQKKT